MVLDARAVANWFINTKHSEGKSLSIMELLKLVYIGHGWHLEVFDKPLISNRIEAWKFGPVIPDVYNEFRGQGVSVTAPCRGYDENSLSEEQKNLMGEILRIYGDMSAFTLSDITHEAGGPWDVASKTYGFFAPIGDDLIRKHYKEKRQIYQASHQKAGS